jgi:hypothetical protein
MTVATGVVKWILLGQEIPGNYKKKINY